MRLPHFFLYRPVYAAWLLVLLSAAFAVGAYLQALHYPFIFDDVDYVGANTRLAELPWTQLWRLFAEPYNDMAEFLPIRELSYWLDIHLFGMTPMAFRIHNIVLYLLCLPLVYANTLNVWRYFHASDEENGIWVAAAVSALFALHPSHAETVIWIAARKDLLSTLFSLLAIWLCISARCEQGISPRYGIAALFALLVALLSKATAVAVAPLMSIIWVVFWLDLPKDKRNRWMLLWPLASLCLAAIIAVIFATIITSKVPVYFGEEAVERTLAVLGWLARLSISPESRHFFYPVFEDPHLPIMVSVGLVLLLVITAVILLRKRSMESFALVAFLMLCLPSLQLIPYAVPSLVSDRFIALAVWPAAFLLVMLVWRMPIIFRVLTLSVIALSWGYQTLERPRDWQSFEVLVDAELRASPGLYIPAIYKIFGFQLHRNEFNEALQTASTIPNPEIRDGVIAMIDADYVLRIEAKSSGDPVTALGLLWNLGLALKHKPEQAKWNLPLNNYWGIRRDLLELEWQFITERFPNDAQVRYHAGLWMLDENKFDSAAINFRAATESPYLQEAQRYIAYKSLGIALIGSGEVAAAETPLLASLNYPQADKQVYCLLSWVYKKSHRQDEAALAQTNCVK